MRDRVPAVNTQDVPFYRRFSKLPEKGTTIESAILDLKPREMSPKNHFTLANDVTAFANHLGGTLLVGATEVEGVVGDYPGLPLPFSDELQTAFSEAIKDRCSPRPVYDFERFSCTPNRHVLAVFVEPYVGGQVIGVAVKGSEQRDTYKGDSYVFPMRAGKDTKPLLPEQLPMFSEPRIRRVFVQLSAIPEDARVHISKAHSNSGVGYETGTLLKIAPDRNAFHVKVHSQEGVTQSVYSIDQVRSVHSDGKKWFIALDLV